MPSHITIHIESSAPPRPVPGASCNGCGVCCLVEPCPLGMVLSRRRRGACDALRWQDGLYRCGAISDTETVLQQALPRYLHGLVSRGVPWLRRWARRWIAAGQGCDCTLEEVGQSDRQSAHD